MVLVFLSPSPTCISVRSISSDSRELRMQHSKKGWCPRYAHANIVSLVRDTRHTVWVSGRVATESPADGDTILRVASRRRIKYGCVFASRRMSQRSSRIYLGGNLKY